jgi:hypothetical protein
MRGVGVQGKGRREGVGRDGQLYRERRKGMRRMTKGRGQGRVERGQKRNRWKGYKEEEGWRKEMDEGKRWDRGGKGPESLRVKTQLWA